MAERPPDPSAEGYDPRADRATPRVEEEAPGVSHHEPIGLRERLSLNRMGTFDWDLESGFMDLDPGAMEVFDLHPGEYDGAPMSLISRVPPEEGLRLDAAVSQALQDGTSSYGAYFRIQCRDGTRRWTHSQGRILHDARGVAYRIIGIVREATSELADSALLRSLQQERQRQTVMVQQTTAALARALSVKDVTRVLTGAGGARRFGADALVLGLVTNDRFEVIATAGLDGEVPADMMNSWLDDTLPLSEAVRSRRPSFLSTRGELIARYPRLRPYVDVLPTGSAAFLPLVAQDTVLGALGLFNHEPAVQSAEARNLALALAGVVAQSLQRATLFDQEREFATGLQAAMLPRRLPPIAGGEVTVRYHPASVGRDVGGDWYDVIQLPQGRTGLVVGDVQGHDTHAAAVMGQLRIALRAYASEGHPPETVLVRASRFLAELETERFATCTYVQADLESGALHLARAGHLGPLICNSSRHIDWPEVRGGLPLGLATAFGQDHFPETQLFLEPGSTLLLCTDGLVEQPGQDISAGIDALSAAVRSGPAALDALADRLSNHLWAEPGSDDDMALLLLHRSAIPGEAATPRLRLHVHQADPAGTAEVRSALRRTLDQWRAGAVTHDVEVAASELIANALTHTESGALVAVELLPGAPRRIRLEVEDRSSQWPRRRRPGETATSGRGLLLVEALADRWGAEPRGSGKALWCEFVVPDDPPGSGT
ncbi:protein phosphatase [Streptomyces noursei ZPM]|uniref:SpoIIE family protein phosphatase n=2 Tax=Streptomyces noursei TaxID=1971 RepID=UPI000335BF73|nr:SpoIIE family protein phosphatase [Streptomyces noursei]AKA07112.1 protein phosphatase [Streptomyces noursei ZPM]EOT00009.1 protein phosphatase [Streptomyces noursei CCRC 11814]EXU85149.1 protein phosphatase [Streptomyces noursei PD-1]UWS75664.1 SpoIIE family protein phosphatase [Streptomyces noursei]